MKGASPRTARREDDARRPAWDLCRDASHPSYRILTGVGCMGQSHTCNTPIAYFFIERSHRWNLSQ